MGIVYSLKIQEYRSYENNSKTVLAVPEDNENLIQEGETDKSKEYKTEKYEDQIITEPLEVYIPSQSRATDIARILEAAGVLENSSAFIQFIEEQDKTTKLRHGNLVFPKNLNYEEILDILIQD